MDKTAPAEKDSNNNAGFLRLINDLIFDLSPRSQEIIKRRYGIFSEKGETLEKIGKHYNITRERIRQIIAESFKNISKKLSGESFREAEERIIFTINRNNGIIKESDVIKKFNLDGNRESNAIKFFVNCSKKIFKIEERGIMEKSWAVSREVAEQAKEIIAEAESKLKSGGKPMLGREIAGSLVKSNSAFSENQILSFLGISLRVKENKFGKWGMVDWAEISPKGTREKVYLVLKEHGQPLHFTGIAELIDEYKLSKNKTHPQTVHNELIKDKRFVLIGRGIYALSEWGYFEGTVKDVLKKILEKSVKPMNKEEIMEEVMKIRKVKKATIAINLNNSEFFEKQRNLYSVKK